MRKNPLEWAVFALSVVLIGALVAVLLRPSGPDEPAPRLTVQPGPAETQAAGVTVPVTVRNDGSGGATDVEVSVRRGSEAVVLRYPQVPRASEREAVAVFAGRADAPVAARIVSYQGP